MKWENDKKIFLFSIIILAGIFLFKTFQLSQIIWHFPSSDYPVYLVRLFFLETQGYNIPIANWYDGWLPFLHYGPAFFFFAQIPYKLFGQLNLAYYLAFLGNYILGFIGFYFIGKAEKWTIIKRIYLFLLFYVCPITIVWFNEMGRTPEMFAWSILILTIALIFTYRKKQIDTKFIILFALLTGILLLSHPSEYILAGIVTLGLFLTKTFREKIKIVIAGLIGIIISSFWLIPFLKTSGEVSFDAYSPLALMLQFPTERIISIIFPLFFMAMLIWYLKDKKWNKKELLFFSPILITLILYMTTIGIHIPIFNKVNTRVYGILAFLFGTILFLKLRYINYKKLIRIGISLLAIAILAIIIIRYPSMPFPFDTNETYQDVVEIFPKVNEKIFLICPEIERQGVADLYSYGAIYHNISTPIGFFGSEETPELRQARLGLYEGIEQQDCSKIIENTKKTTAKELLGCTPANCELLESCGLTLKAETENACVFSLN